MGVERVSTGSDALNDLLIGGYETDVVTTLYGPAGSGKTNLCLMAMLDMIKKNKKKAIFIDTEGGFSLSRLEQLSPRYKDVLDNILLFKPMSFDEQKRVFTRLKKLLNDKIGLIVIDSISMLYRLELGKNEDNVSSTNKELSFQISVLTEIARKLKIPVLVTSQVYSNFDERDKVNMVGGDILKYGSKCLVELQKLSGNKKRFLLRKHRSLPEGKEEIFEIRNEGIIKTDIK